MLSNARIGTRVICLIAIQCFLLLVVGLIALAGSAHGKDRPHGGYGDSIVPLLYLDTVQGASLQMRVQLDQALSADSAAAMEKHFEAIAALGAEVDRAWSDYTGASMSAEEHELAEGAAQAREAVMAACAQVRAAFQSGGPAAAVAAGMRGQRSQKFDRWRAAVDELITFHGPDARSASREAQGLR